MARLGEGRDCVRDREDVALEVRVEHAVPIVFVDHHIGLRARFDSRILDQDIEASRHVPGTIEESSEALAVTDVEVESDRLSARRPALFAALFDLLDPARPEADEFAPGL